ncbi:glycosyltransferase [Persephonella atlantica]|uniref:Glycosyltransferase n=1 Tax=Persephonella atlantica TaxID=2699429 RepID=A0ABS1GG00_9AQUI|nr:glycosyltransferase [Persephonella atlantica]MBK3331847.1 glycosyltransferase [Persephonella atlantica]
MRKKIILYLPSIQKGGVLESNRLLAKGFHEKGYEVTIVSNRKTDITIESFNHIYLHAGDLTKPFKLKKVILEEKPIAIFSNMLPQNISLSLAKYLLSYYKYDIETKFFGFVRTSTSSIVHSKFYHKPYKKFVNKLYTNFDKIIAVSSIAKQDLVNAFSLPENKIEIIHNPIDVRNIEKSKKEELSEEEKIIFRKKVLMFAGRFSKEKRIDLILKIFHKLQKMRDDVNLLLIGEGEEEENIKKILKELTIKNVYMLPFTKNPFKYMKHATLFILTSENEGFSRVVLESFSCGTPVIAYENNMSGHKDIIKSGYNGYLVKFNAEDTFIRKINTLLDNRDLLKTLENNAYKTALNFSLDNIINKLELLINS